MSVLKMQEWMQLHPYRTLTYVDYAYLKIANVIYDCCKDSVFDEEYEYHYRANVSFAVTAYLEDVVSYIGLWRAFTNKHEELYGTPLPFYTINPDTYLEDEINQEDILFIVWNCLQKRDLCQYIDPYDPDVVELAQEIYQLLDAEFEKVPQNDSFLSYIQNKEQYKDLSSYCRIADWVCYDSYLMGFENTLMLGGEMKFAEDKFTMPELRIFHSLRSEFMFERKTGPILLPTNEWVAKMLKDSGLDEEIDAINAIEFHGYDLFMVNSSDDTYVYASDTLKQEYAILRSSLKTACKKDILNCTLSTSIVKYKGEWHFIGLQILNEDDGSYSKRIITKAEEILERQINYERVLKANNGSQIAYFKDVTHLKKWMEAVQVYSDKFVRNITKKDKNIVLFASPTTDIGCYPQMGYSIKDPMNPYYNVNVSNEESIDLLVFLGRYSLEMFNYMYDRDMLSHIRSNYDCGQDRGHKVIHGNIKFLAKFFVWMNAT